MYSTGLKHGRAMTTTYTKMNVTARMNCRARQMQNRVVLNRLCNTVPQNITGSSALVVFHANSGTTYIRTFTKRDRNLEDQALLDCDLKCGILMFSLGSPLVSIVLDLACGKSGQLVQQSKSFC